MNKFGCMMALVDLPNWEEIKAMVNAEDIYDPDGDHGFSSTPHVTLLYGFHQVVIHKIIQFASELNPIPVIFKGVSLFENEEFDVLKITVESDVLHVIHNKIKEQFEVTCTFPEYKPHMTICYLNKGTGRKYLDGTIQGIPEKQLLTKLKYTDPLGQKLFVDFSK